MKNYINASKKHVLNIAPAGNVALDRIVGIFPTGIGKKRVSRFIQAARTGNWVVDMSTQECPARSFVVMDTGHVILSPYNPDKLIMEVEDG